MIFNLYEMTLYIIINYRERRYNQGLLKASNQKIRGLHDEV